VDLVSIGEFARLSRLSPKALRLYDQLGLLPPERVDPGSGYRWYAPGQLRQARLVAALPQIEMPLQEIKAILDLDPDAAAEQLAGYWVGVETEHAARRALTGSLVGYLDGERSVMYDVATRNVPARSLLCLQRHVNSGQIRAVGRDFIARFRDGSVPRLEGVPGRRRSSTCPARRRSARPRAWPSSRLSKAGPPGSGVSPTEPCGRSSSSPRPILWPWAVL
jgi:DNA-binding transcriptional MerR regulator